jgi:hypothetical protein
MTAQPYRVGFFDAPSRPVEGCTIYVQSLPRLAELDPFQAEPQTVQLGPDRGDEVTFNSAI